MDMAEANKRKTSASKIVDIPIKLLTHSKRNVRKTPPSKESHDELVAAIRAIGVLHPPTVIEGDEGLFEVIAGGRRLKAIQALVEEGHYSEDDKIACRKVSADNLEEISLIENTHRQPMHPADEFEAFRKMQKNGATPADIALHLGISEKTVYQRLKLGQVAPAILKAYRNDEIKLSAVMAFTIEDDKARQLEVFQALQNNGRGDIWEREVRAALKGDTETSETRIGKFVGQQAYEEAGGAVSQDLFQDVVYFNDSDLVRKLAMEKLHREADQLSPDWNWVEVTLDPPEYGQEKTIRAFDTQETAPLREQLDTIQTHIETLHDTVDVDDWTDKHDEQLHRLEAKADEVEEAIYASQAYLPEEMKCAGCQVAIGHNGTLSITKGIIRKGDEKKLADAHDKKTSKKKSPANKPSGELEGDNTYSQALIDDLTTYRLNIAKNHLARSGSVVQNLLIYTLCCKFFEDFYYNAAVKLSIEATNPASSLSQPDTSQAFSDFTQRRTELSLDWLSIKDDGERFEAFTALPDSDKFDLMAYCVASAFTIHKLNHSANEVAEIVIRGLDIPWHKEFKPTTENYFGRLSKEHLIEHGKLFLDDDWPARAAKRSKKELANELEEVFAGQDQTMPVEKRAEAADWVPESFKTGTMR